jgi:hypothetical protein
VLQSSTVLTELSVDERVGKNYIHSTPRKKINHMDGYSVDEIQSSSCNENVYETSGGSRKSQTAFLAWNSPDGRSVSRYPPSLPPEKLMHVTPYAQTPENKIGI